MSSEHCSVCGLCLWPLPVAAICGGGFGRLGDWASGVGDRGRAPGRQARGMGPGKSARGNGPEEMGPGNGNRPGDRVRGRPRDWSKGIWPKA